MDGEGGYKRKKPARGIRKAAQEQLLQLLAVE
jgi:hypothetical protein